MKNQYFGDSRDLFKYDLILRLSQKTNINRLLFASMLTVDDKSNDGNNSDYSKTAGVNNKELFDFLKKKE